MRTYTNTKAENHMNKIIALALAVLAAIAAYGQEEEPMPKGWYASAGVSWAAFGGTDSIAQSSFPQVEVGRYYGNVSFALNLGRRDLAAREETASEDYYFEAKAAASIPVGWVDMYATVGLGSYFGTSYLFSEYGWGITFPLGDRGWSLSTQASRWDGAPYLSTCINKSF